MCTIEKKERYIHTRLYTHSSYSLYRVAALNRMSSVVAILEFRGGIGGKKYWITLKCSIYETMQMKKRFSL